MNVLLPVFGKGLVFGITMAAIPGPIFFLIIQKTLNDGAFMGMICSLGAVCADALYALIAAIGLTIVSKLLIHYQGYLSIAGGLFLCFLSIRLYIRHIKKYTITPQAHGVFSTWISTAALTLTNPVTILSYTLILSSLGLNTQNNIVSSLALVSGVILGASLIDLCLVGFISIAHKKIPGYALSIINKISGILLFIFGILAIIRGIATLFVH